MDARYKIKINHGTHYLSGTLDGSNWTSFSLGKNGEDAPEIIKLLLGHYAHPSDLDGEVERLVDELIVAARLFEAMPHDIGNLKDFQQARQALLSSLIPRRDLAPLADAKAALSSPCFFKTGLPSIDGKCVYCGRPTEEPKLAGVKAEVDGEAKDEDAEYIRTLERGIQAVRNLMNESNGVTGLHLNGDTAPWESLEAGGSFGAWLDKFSEADAAMRQRQEPRP